MTHLKAASSIAVGVILIPGGYFPLDEKIIALAQAGFQGVEVYLWDLIPYTEQLFSCKLGDGDIFNPNFTDDDWKLLIQASERVGALCRSHGLQVLSAAALFAAEGWPKGSEQAATVRANLIHWSEMMKALGTDLLVAFMQVAANQAPPAQIDLNMVAEDLGEFADVLSQSGQRIAYENLAWATTAPTWSAAWDVVKEANRPNLGLCLDVFHVAASEWADPTTTSGRIEEPNAMADFDASLKRLTADVPPTKIFSIQLGDAYKLPEPADPKKLKWTPKLYWAAGFRAKPHTGGGFLPVDEILNAILRTGYQGPISIEAFDGGKDGKTPPAGSALEQAKILSEAWDKSLLACS